MIYDCRIFCEIAIRWVSQGITDYKATLIHVMDEPVLTQIYVASLGHNELTYNTVMKTRYQNEYNMGLLNFHKSAILWKPRVFMIPTVSWLLAQQVVTPVTTKLVLW